MVSKEKTLEAISVLLSKVRASQKEFIIERDRISKILVERERKAFEVESKVIICQDIILKLKKDIQLLFVASKIESTNSKKEYLETMTLELERLKSEEAIAKEEVKVANQRFNFFKDKILELEIEKNKFEKFIEKKGESARLRQEAQNEEVDDELANIVKELNKK